MKVLLSITAVLIFSACLFNNEAKIIERAPELESGLYKPFPDEQLFYVSEDGDVQTQRSTSDYYEILEGYRLIPRANERLSAHDSEEWINDTLIYWIDKERNLHFRESVEDDWVLISKINEMTDSSFVIQRLFSSDSDLWISTTYKME